MTTTPENIYCSRGKNFYREFHAEWPYSLYFSDLNQGSLKVMTYCCLDKLTDLKVDGDSKVLVRPAPVQMGVFLSRGFGAINVMCERAEMFKSLLFQRVKAATEYYGLS